MSAVPPSSSSPLVPPPPAPPRPAGTPGLAIAALVLSLLLFVPLAPLVGAILGLVGLGKIGKGQAGRGMCVAAIPVGLGLFLLAQVVPTVISIQAFTRFVALAKASEARESLYSLRYGATDAAMQDQVDASGNVLPASFPRGDTGWTPTHGCCSQPSRPACTRDDADWDRQPWRALQWQPEPTHSFQYRYVSDGRTLTAEARGDLDCDGELSRFTLKGRIEDGAPVFDSIQGVNEDE